MPSSGVLLGVGTALSWGSADFLARFAARSLGSVRAAFWMQAWGAVFLTIFLFGSSDWGHLFDSSGWQPWAWGALAGLLNTFAMLALYRAFEVGKMTVVAPISASYPALTVVLTLFSGDRLSLTRAVGIFAALLGVLLVAGVEKTATATGESVAPKETSGRAGIAWAISAAVGFGFLFWLLGVRVTPRTGALATVWLIRLIGTLLIACVLLIQKIPPRLSNPTTAAQTAGMGLLDTGAFVLSNLGMTLDHVGIISVLGSLYGAVTVILAAILLHERLAALQWLGGASIFLGIFLMNN